RFGLHRNLFPACRVDRDLKGGMIFLCCSAASISPKSPGNRKEKNMKRTRKSTRATPVEKNEVVESFVPLYTKSMERIAELQKNSLDIAMQQSSEMIHAWRKVLPPGTPGLFMFDMMAQMFERYIDTQKGTIDLAIEQGYASKVGEGMTGLFQRSIDHTIAAQKKALDSFAEQNKAVYEAAKRQLRFS